MVISLFLSVSFEVDDIQMSWSKDRAEKNSGCLPSRGRIWNVCPVRLHPQCSQKTHLHRSSWKLDSELVCQTSHGVLRHIHDSRICSSACQKVSRSQRMSQHAGFIVCFFFCLDCFKVLQQNMQSYCKKIKNKIKIYQTIIRVFCRE